MQPLSIRSEVRSHHQDFWEPDPMTRRSTTGKGTRCGEQGRSTGSTLTPSGPEDLATVLLETVWTYHIPRVLRRKPSPLDLLSIPSHRVREELT